ncbi:MAG: molybdopterin-dependent oxidoreductase [Aeromicrobium sp.]
MRQPDSPDIDIALPPGQQLINGFPRFGEHLSKPAPPIPPDPSIEVRGALTQPLVMPLTTLARLPRRELRADFHCVAGWSAADLQWEGVMFADVYREIIEPVLAPGAEVTHVVFRGLDGFRSVLQLEDALADDVIIAERLNGLALDGDHGAPARLVSPRQYGYMSTKHLCRIELHTQEPPVRRSIIQNFFFNRHPRARVWEEERHRFLPLWAIRPAYRAAITPFIAVCARGNDQAVRDREKDS